MEFFQAFPIVRGVFTSNEPVNIVLALGIIFLFICMSINPSTGNINKASFNIKTNNPPYEPSNPIPPDGATNVSIYTSLCWTGGDPDGDLVIYDVYFGKNYPPNLIINNQSLNCTCPYAELEFNTKYFWKIVAWDPHGSTEGPIWSFTTIESPHNTLYVGGIGPNNYTSIQDAIDNASNGDTVFVYNGTYYENVIVNKSIDLIGENKNTTIIDGGGKEKVVWIKDYNDGVSISGFTIQKCGNNSDEFFTNAGIYISSSYNIIFDNNIVDNNGIGISIWLDHEWTYNNIIYGNIIKNNVYGILTCDSFDSKIFDNYIANQIYGICFCPQDFPVKGASYLSFRYWETEIYRNTFTNNEVGIYQFCWGGDDIYENKIINNGRGIYMNNYHGCGGYNNVFNNSIIENQVGIDISAFDGGSTNNNIYRNNITNNGKGIDIDYLPSTDGADDNKIYQNNFIDNQEYNVRDRCKNHYDANYWDNWIGFRIKLSIFQRFPKIIFGRGIWGLMPPFTFDWHPAQEPYDIEVVI